MNVLVVDNYDSFTYNLASALGSLGGALDVRRNDVATPDDIDAFDAVVISPGPGVPEDAGCTVRIVEACVDLRKPILGVCLGQQAIVHALGGRIVRAPAVRHGMTSRIFHEGRNIFAGVPRPFEAMRYHSLVCDPTTLPDDLMLEAWTEDGLVMAVAHRDLPMFGVQFHPESILTPDGALVLANFLEIAYEFDPTKIVTVSPR